MPLWVRPVGADAWMMERIVVVLVEIDELRQVQTTLGNHVADELMGSVATRLAHVVGPVGTVVGLGEAFVVWGRTNQVSAGGLRRRVSAGFAHPVALAGTQVPVAVSLTDVVAYPEPALLA